MAEQEAAKSVKESRLYYEIKTKRLLLRPLSVSDLYAVHKYASDHENTYYMMRLPNQTLEETADFLDRVAKEWKKSEPSFYEFAVILSGSPIGHVSLYLDEDKTVGELGWIFDRDRQKQGYAYESACAIRDFAFNTLRLEKIIAQCDYRNSPSYRLMERIGLKLESDNGTRTYEKRNETVKELTYSLSRGDSNP